MTKAEQSASTRQSGRAEESPNSEESIGALITRIEEQAMSAEMQDSLGIERWVALWQQRLAPIFQQPYHRLYDPLAPRLAELLSAHLDDASFVERVYSFLVGRLPEQQGDVYYRQMAAREGRITALITLLQADEAQEHIKQKQLQLPNLLLRLNRWYQRLDALPGLYSVGRWVWRAVVNLLWRRYQLRWQEQGEFYDTLALQGRRHQEHQALAVTLKEMADIQQIILTVGIAKPESSQSQASSPVPTPETSFIADNSLNKRLTDEQAIAMSKLLRNAQRALHTHHKEAP